MSTYIPYTIIWGYDSGKSEKTMVRTYHVFHFLIFFEFLDILSITIQYHEIYFEIPRNSFFFRNKMVMTSALRLRVTVTAVSREVGVAEIETAPLNVVAIDPVGRTIDPVACERTYR